MPSNVGATDLRRAGSQATCVSVLVTMPDGGILAAPARTGARLIDALAGYGIPVRQDVDELGDAIACGRFNQAWAARLPAPDPNEWARPTAKDYQDGACRALSTIVLTPDLDGLEFELPWDALVPQTYWVAG